MEFVPDWSGLPPELLEQIAKCLLLMEDFTAFRGVCTTWRAAVLRKNKYQFKVPLLMLAEKHQSYKRRFYIPSRRKVLCYRHACKCKIYRLSSRKKKHERHGREFYSLSKRKICARLPFPGAKGKRCIDVGYGWILTVSASGGNAKAALGDISDGKVSLVKPFYSSPKIKLPNMKEFPNYEEFEIYPDFNFFQRAVLLADPSETSDFMLVLLTYRYLVFWRNGDKNWTRINPDKPVWGFVNMVHYKGCIYAMCGSKLWIWDPNGNDLTKAQVVMQLDDASQLVSNKMVYSVESTDGELLVLVRNNHTSGHDYVSKGANYFRVMRVDIEARVIEDIEGVGEDAIFVGNNTTVAVAARDYPGVLRPNCIYFTDDRIEAYILSLDCMKGGGKDMGIYNVEDGSIERFGIRSFSPISPPMWIFPSF